MSASVSDARKIALRSASHWYVQLNDPRHKASLGGVNILALWLQQRTGLRAGKLQMAVDTCVVLASLWVVSLPMLLASVCGAVVLNLIIAMNHRPGRYIV